VSRTALLLALLSPSLLVGMPGGGGQAMAAAEPQRTAIVVGARRAPPGRAPLRYAHDDARRVSEVLTGVAGFAVSDVKVLLDPRPEALLAALDHELAAAAGRARETFLFFYYSGHADDRAIFPAGEPLAFAALKQRLDDRRIKLRMGLLDSCRGGGWTGSKGLSRVEPFDIEPLMPLVQEGSVLIASSSGQENAHEAEALEGSFFTHHWNAGLRGAADRGGDGVVTLGEAFEYARTLTIRDTALIGGVPQHPSFQMRLSGRQDFPLVTMATQRTTLLFDQTSGPVEFVRLNEGLVVLETEAGKRKLRLGLPAGSYLVRRRDGDGVWARVVALSGGGVTSLAEADLVRSGFGPGRTKDAGAGTGAGVDGFAQAEEAPWSEQQASLSVALGVRHAPVIDPGLRLASAEGDAAFMLRASFRIARRLWLAAPLALVMDSQGPGAVDWFFWGGAPVVGGADEAAVGFTVRGFVGAGADLRWRLGQTRALNASVAELGAFRWGQAEAARAGPTTWTTQVTMGISQALPPSVKLNLAVGLGSDVLAAGAFAAGGIDAPERHTVLAFGSVQRRGLRPLPLIHVALGGGWGIDAHVVAAYVLPTRTWVETYMAGVSYVR
jgi:hypothetical protein